MTQAAERLAPVIEIGDQQRRTVRRMVSHVPADTLVGYGRTYREFLTPPGIRITGESVQLGPERERRESPFGTVMLRMYDHEDTRPFESLVSHYIGEKTLGKLQSLVNSDTREDPQTKIELDRVKRGINKKVYGVIRNGLGLSTPKEAENKFKEVQQSANDAVEEHASNLYQDDFTAQFRNEVSLGLSPADLFEAFVNKRTDPVLRFELQRQFNNIVIGLQLEQNLPSNGENKLSQIQTLLNDKFYDPTVGRTQYKEVFGLFDDRENDIVGDPLYDRPTEAPEGRFHYKRFILPVRKLETGEEVLTLTSIKKRSTSINKALRKATENDLKGKGDAIDVATDVRDSHRMKIIVLGDQNQANDVRDRVFDLITDPDNFRYFYDQQTLESIADMQPQNGAPNGTGDIKETNGGYAGQSEEVDIFRMLIDFEGVGTPAEIGFQTAKSYMRDVMTVGRFDRARGKFMGPAHELYAIQREVPITDSVFPPDLYGALQRPYDTDGRGPFPKLAAKAKELRHKYKYSGPFNVFQA